MQAGGLIAIWLTSLAQISGADVVKVAVTPYACHPPCTVRVTVRIERHDANRMLRVAVYGPEYSRYSEMALDGQSKVTFLLYYRDLPEGRYEISADVVRHDARTWVAGYARGEFRVGGFSE